MTEDLETRARRLLANPGNHKRVEMMAIDPPGRRGDAGARPDGELFVTQHKITTVRIEVKEKWDAETWLGFFVLLALVVWLFWMAIKYS